MAAEIHLNDFTEDRLDKISAIMGGDRDWAIKHSLALTLTLLFHLKENGASIELLSPKLGPSELEVETMYRQPR